MADHDIPARCTPSAGAIALLYLATLACAGWALVVLLGYATTQGAEVPAAGVVLAFAPSLTLLVVSAILMRRAHRARAFGARLWWLLPPTASALYLVATAVAAVLDA